MNEGSDVSERALPSNAIAVSVTDEPAEYAESDSTRCYSRKTKGVSPDANSNVTVLLDRDQVEAVRETLEGIVAELGGGER